MFNKIKNKKAIIIIVASALVLLAIAPWMNNKSIQSDILQKYGTQDGSIDKNGNLFCAYEARWLPFGRWFVSCEGGYFVPFFYFKKGNNDNAQKQQIHENNKVVTENANWKTYRNEKYGFEVKYPADIFQLDKNTNTLSHTLKNFHKYSMKDGSDLGLANDISVIFKIENNRGCNFLETELGLKPIGIPFEFKNIKGVKYETGAEGEGIIYYCVKNKDNQNIFLIERLFLNTSYSTELPKQNDHINDERQENIFNQILSTFKFTK